MRAIFISYVLVLVSLALGVVGEFNQLHIRDKGYPLVFYGETGYLNQTLNGGNFNSTLQNYGMDRIPSQAGSNFYLGTGGQILTTYNAFKDIFLFTTLGASNFLLTAFPSMPLSLVLIIDVALSLNNILAAISFLRGMVLK